MKKLIFKTFLLLSIIFINSCNSINNCDEIYELMKEQEKSWNMGNIDDFMDKYWDNNSLIFIVYLCIIFYIKNFFFSQNKLRIFRQWRWRITANRSITYFFKSNKYMKQLFAKKKIINWKQYPYDEWICSKNKKSYYNYYRDTKHNTCNGTKKVYTTVSFGTYNFQDTHFIVAINMFNR